MELLKSASRIVLLLFAVGCVVALFTGHIGSDLFEKALLMVLTYYFTKSISNSKD
jgi:uncharacterized membrane protein